MTTTNAPALTGEQAQALRLLAMPDPHANGTSYVLRQRQAENAHSQVARLLTRIGRPDVIQSGPVRELGSLAADPGPFCLHPADEQAVATLARAFPELNGVRLTFLLDRLSHDSIRQHRARKAAGAR